MAKDKTNEAGEEVVHTKILELSIDLQREDLNTVVAKINEIIAHINK